MFFFFCYRFFHTLLFLFFSGFRAPIKPPWQHPLVSTAALWMDCWGGTKGMRDRSEWIGADGAGLIGVRARAGSRTTPGGERGVGWPGGCQALGLRRDVQSRGCRRIVGVCYRAMLPASRSLAAGGQPPRSRERADAGARASVWARVDAGARGRAGRHRGRGGRRNGEYPSLHSIHFDIGNGRA